MKRGMKEEGGWREGRMKDREDGGRERLREDVGKMEEGRGGGRIEKRWRKGGVEEG